MARSRTVLLSLGLALLAGTGCGKSREAELVDSLRVTCRQMVTESWTLDQATVAFTFRPDVIACPPPNAGTLPDDHCDYGQATCSAFWVGLARDQSLCRPGLGGCWYWCEGRYAGGYPPSGSEVLCAERFVTGQPAPP